MGFRRVFFLLFAASGCLAQTAGYSLPEVYSSSGELRSGTLPLPKIAGGENYSLLFSLDPALLAPASRVTVAVVDGDRVLLSKTLHAGDADLYGFFRPVRVPELRIAAEGVVHGQFQLQINRKAANGGPNHTWEEAAQFTRGELVTASGDDAEYVPLPGTPKKDLVENLNGEHWYRFRFNEPRPKLVFFQLELMDRDGLPADIDVFRLVQGKIQEFHDSRDPVTLPHEVQALPAERYSIANGYPLVQRAQLQFLQERFANNPRPFYGFEDHGAVWSRVISAPGMVLSRMSVLKGLYEQYVTGIAQPAWHQGVAEYLKLYYAGRTKLPPDETNGNTPLVSAYQVAWYSWKVTHDPRLPEMIAQGEVKNMIDLCYQTLALAEIDKTKYAAQLKANVDRILSLQRESGQWAMPFDPKQPEVEFQTGHALWALAAAGLKADHPQVRKAVAYLLQRQQPWGGWFDPLQSYENFKTPFRETQFAVLALSTLYPGPGHKKGWDAPAPQSLPANPAFLVPALDAVWERPSPDVLRVIEDITGSNEVLVRQAAVEALGRLAPPQTGSLLAQRLGDASKLVQRAAAWSLRQVYAAHPETNDAELLAAMSSRDARTRWGAT